jgi:hypothetical protein
VGTRDIVNSTQTIKLVAIASLIILSTGILIAWNNPATHYESSIYLATPKIFWISVASCLFSGIVIIIQQLVYNNNSTYKHNLWVIGILLVFVSFTAIISLFITRGYVLWCEGDPLTHIGLVNNILSSGHEAQGEIYPVVHIFVAQISLVFNIAPNILSKLIPFIFALLSVGFSYCLAKAILPRKDYVILATLITMTLLQVWAYLAFIPNYLANLIFPLAFYLLVKYLTEEDFIWKVLFFIILILYPLFHPIPSFALLFILIAFWPSYSQTRIMDQKSVSVAKTKISSHVVALLFLLAWMYAWFSTFSIWGSLVHNVILALTEKITRNLDILGQNIAYSSQYNYSVTEMFLKTYGGIAILLLLSLIAIPLLWRRRNSDLKCDNLLKLSFTVIIFTVIVAGLYLMNLGFQPERFLPYIVLIFMFGASITLGEAISGITKYIFSLSIGVIIISVLCVSGTLILYPSRYVLNNNWQITQSKVDGMNWFLHKKDTIVRQTGIDLPFFRFSQLLLTSNERSQRNDIYYYDEPSDIKVKWHFGYDEYSNLGQEYNKDLYLVLDDAAKSYYREVVTEMASLRFQTEDYLSLENDNTVDKTYTNAGLDVFYIHSNTSR